VRLFTSEFLFNLSIVDIQGIASEHSGISSEEAARVIESLKGGTYFLTFYSPHFNSKVRLVRK
ncbi:MAG: hypothetical protein RIF46_15100, partial [Cyclobacteriaceae bacterium]